MTGVQTCALPIYGGIVRGFQRDIEGADLIYKVNGERVHNRDEVEDSIRSTSRTESLRLTLRRGGIYGKEREVSVVPAWE